MSEVKRIYFSVEDLGAVADGKTDCTYALQSAGFYVPASDFDRVTAERDAALAELATQDRVLRSSVPQEHKGCTSPVGAVQNYIGDLEQRLTAADQGKDDLSFQLNDREASRYDWLQAAQVAEKECERLREERDSFQRVGIKAMEQLAERDALLRRARQFTFDLLSPQRLRDEIEALLIPSSAEPKCQDGGMCGDSSHKCTGCAPVERDERAGFDEWFRKEKGLHPEADTTHIDAAFIPYRAWMARAALDKATEGALKPAEDGDAARVEDFIRLNSAPHCPECGHPDCNGQCFGDDMMGDS